MKTKSVVRMVMSMAKFSKNKVYYLVSPFTHSDPKVEKKRYLEQQTVHAHLIKEYGLNIIAPIESCYHLHSRFNLPGGYEFWKKRDRKFIKLSDGIIVCKMDGLADSVGCQDEIKYAKLLKKEIHYIDVP